MVLVTVARLMVTLMAGEVIGSGNGEETSCWGDAEEVSSLLR